MATVVGQRHCSGQSVRFCEVMLSSRHITTPSSRTFKKPSFPAKAVELRRNARCTAPVSSIPRASGGATSAPAADTLFSYKQLDVQTLPGISLFDITAQIKDAVQAAGLQEGFVNIISRHTTTAVVINENEVRLMDDIRLYLRRLAPPTDPYLHNDLHLREAPQDWPGGRDAWVAQEPVNAHSHILSILLGNSETIPVTRGQLTIGRWQSVLLVDLDGPRPRTVGVQLVGQTSK